MTCEPVASLPLESFVRPRSNQARDHGIRSLYFISVQLPSHVLELVRRGRLLGRGQPPPHRRGTAGGRVPCRRERRAGGNRGEGRCWQLVGSTGCHGVSFPRRAAPHRPSGGPGYRPHKARAILPKLRRSSADATAAGTGAARLGPPREPAHWPGAPDPGMLSGYEHPDRLELSDQNRRGRGRHASDGHSVLLDDRDDVVNGVTLHRRGAIRSVSADMLRISKRISDTVMPGEFNYYVPIDPE
ncbi:hypothetical protein DFJ74DRAFT_740193 [Hyaloraphidium curvatum]|nr:hypothetical protein DFJ74DRAFT_740193 [Hyaloraphidium curvatum]